MSVTPPKNRREKIEMARYIAQTKGGEVEHIIDELTPAGQPFDDKKLTKRGYMRVKIYDYTAMDGTLLYQSLRYHHHLIKNDKKFLLRHPDPYTEEWIFGQPIKIIYRWPDVATNPDKDVFVCEGEKDADRLASLGLIATTVAGQNWSETAASALRERNVIILEDNDAEGRANAEASAEALRYVAKSIRILKLPGLKHKEDVSDWLDAGRTLDELTALANETPKWGVFLPFMNLAELDNVEVPEQEWAVENRIPLGYTTLFSGEGASGKSLLQLQLSVAHVLGKDWLGTPVRQGPALFIDAEDNENIIHKRLADILFYYRAKFADVAGKLHITSLTGQDAVLATLSRKSTRIEL
jgi:hypothetical protein